MSVKFFYEERCRKGGLEEVGWDRGEVGFADVSLHWELQSSSLRECFGRQGRSRGREEYWDF
jgi:hypothetical protein